MPSELTTTSPVKSIGDSSKSHSQQSSTSTSTRSVQTETSTETNVDESLPTDNSKSTEAKKQKDADSSPEPSPAKHFVVRAEINEGASTSRTEKSVPNSTGSTPSKLSGILSIQKSPYKQNFLKSRVVCSKTVPHTSPKKIRFQEPPKHLDEIYDFPTVQPHDCTPPSPAPEDPEIEALRNAFKIRDAVEKESWYGYEVGFYESRSYQRNFSDNFEATYGRRNSDKNSPTYSHASYLPMYGERPRTNYRRSERADNYNNKPSTSKWKMNIPEEVERKIVFEFCRLLEKSKQLFNGLR